MLGTIATQAMERKTCKLTPWGFEERGTMSKKQDLDWKKKEWKERYRKWWSGGSRAGGAGVDSRDWADWWRHNSTWRKSQSRVGKVLLLESENISRRNKLCIVFIFKT
jgi:hypothetical protein